MASKPKPAASAPPVTIRVLSPIVTGEGRFEIGEEVEMGDAQAAALIEAGAAELVPAPPAPAA